MGLNEYSNISTSQEFPAPNKLFNPWQELPLGIVDSGKKGRPSGRRAGGRHAFVSGPL